MKFSIIVVTYHPVWEKLKLTLESILRQTMQDYEIVISDDGSEDNCFALVEAYFKEHHFERYTLIPHTKNQGTVRNLIDAVGVAKGKYVRDFGPGDLFYEEHTLQKVYDFMEKEQCEGCFGLMRGYFKEEKGEILFVDFLHPFDLAAYQSADENRILKNLVLYRDNASGACTCYTRDFYLEYLKRLEGTVIYTEDIFQVLAALDGRRLYFFPDYLVWYEADSGVSTKKKSSFSDALGLDLEHFYEMMQREYPNQIYVRRQKKIQKIYRIHNVHLRAAMRVLCDWSSLKYLYRHWRQTRDGSYRPKKVEPGFLDSQDSGLIL